MDALSKTQSQICVYYPVAPYNDAYSNKANAYLTSNFGRMAWWLKHTEAGEKKIVSVTAYISSRRK